MTATETMNPTVARIRAALDAALDLVERIDPPEWVNVTVEYRSWADQPPKVQLDPHTMADLEHIESRMPGAVWEPREHRGSVWDTCRYFDVDVDMFEPHSWRCQDCTSAIRHLHDPKAPLWG